MAGENGSATMSGTTLFIGMRVLKVRFGKRSCKITVYGHSVVKYVNVRGGAVV